MNVNSNVDLFITVTEKMHKLPAECLGLLVKWTLDCSVYDCQISVDGEMQKLMATRKEMANILHILEPFLNADRLKAGYIEPLSLLAGIESQPNNFSADDKGASTKWDDIENQLKLRGIDHGEICRSLGQWKQLYSDQEVLMAMAAMEGRKLSKPLSYMSTILSNFRKTNGSISREADVGLSGARPKPVKKFIRVGPRAGWVMEGWTCRVHPKAGPGVEGRKQVWRSETGSLSYRNPNLEICKIPSFEEDAGVYEID